MNALLNYSFGNYILPNTKNIIPEVGFGQRPIKRFPFLRVSFYRDNFMHLGYHNQKLLTVVFWGQTPSYRFWLLWGQVSLYPFVSIFVYVINHIFTFLPTTYL